MSTVLEGKSFLVGQSWTKKFRVLTRKRIIKDAKYHSDVNQLHYDTAAAIEEDETDIIACIVTIVGFVSALVSRKIRRARVVDYSIRLKEGLHPGASPVVTVTILHVRGRFAKGEVLIKDGKTMAAKGVVLFYLPKSYV